MTVSELLPAFSELTHRDKLRVLQHLATELAGEPEAHMRPPETDLISQTAYPIWSPFAAHDAADALLSALAADSGGQP